MSFTAHQQGSDLTPAPAQCIQLASCDSLRKTPFSRQTHYVCSLFHEFLTRRLLLSILRYLTHTAPVFWQWYSATYKTERWGDGVLSEREYVHHPSSHERKGASSIAIVDLGWNVAVDSVLVFSNTNSRQIQVRIGNDLWDTQMGANATTCGRPIDTQHSGLSTVAEDGTTTYRYAVADCSNQTGRYITLMSTGTNQYFEIRELLVNGTAMQPTPEPRINRYPLVSTPSPVIRPTAAYTAPLKDHFRVYASMYKAHNYHLNHVHSP